MAWQLYPQDDLLLVREAWEKQQNPNTYTPSAALVSKYKTSQLQTALNTALQEHFKVVCFLLETKLPFGIYKVRYGRSNSKKGVTDWFDVEYIIKRLLENLKVYISDAAYNQVSANPSSLLWKSKASASKKATYSDIITSINPTNPPSVKNRLNAYIGDAALASGFVWEHVVPTSCFVEYLKELKKQKDEGKMTENQLKAMLNQLIEEYGNVCIVTDAENNNLNAAGLRNAMPSGWNWKNGSPWARYNAVGIQVH